MDSDDGAEVGLTRPTRGAGAGTGSGASSRRDSRELDPASDEGALDDYDEELGDAEDVPPRFADSAEGVRQKLALVSVI
jgi:hypothetical protein